MAMEITGNLPDYSVRQQNYGSYAMQGMAESSVTNSTKKKEAEKTPQTAGNNKPKSTADYMNELAKLVPSVELKVGTGFSSAKTGKTLTIHPQLLEKMQNDPKKEKEMKELIKGVESAVNMLDSVMNASGWTVVFKHDYIDENGKYHQIALVRNDFMLNLSDELREERRQNSEKLLEKTKEKKVEKQEELEEMFEEKKEEKIEADEQSAYGKAAQLIEEKMAASQDGRIYLDDADMKAIIDAVKDDAGKASEKEKVQVGANLDLQV